MVYGIRFPTSGIPDNNDCLLQSCRDKIFHDFTSIQYLVSSINLAFLEKKLPIRGEQGVFDFNYLDEY